MRYAISLTRRAAFGVAAATLAAGALLFSAGLLVGASTAAVSREASALLPAHASDSTAAAAKDSTQAAADSTAELPVFSAPAADCPPAAAGTASAARHRPSTSASTSASPEPRGTLVAGRTVGTYRDEAHALAARQRYETIGVEAFIEAWAGADGEPVFRVVAGRAP